MKKSIRVKSMRTKKYPNGKYTKAKSITLKEIIRMKRRKRTKDGKYKNERKCIRMKKICE